MYLRKKMYSGKRLARGQTHRRGGWRRVISVALCAVLLSTNMVGVCAADLFDDTSCICDVLCGDEGNSACPVCAEDPAQCAAEAQPPEDEKTPVCICDILCGDEGNSACPVCAEDPAQCAAKAQPPEPEETYIIGWTWVDEEGFLTEYDGEWYLSLPGAERDDLTEELLEEMLPKKLCVELSDGETEYLPITWDFSPLLDISQTYFRLDAEIEEGYVLDEDVDAPYVLLEYGGAELYAGTYPGTRRALTGADKLADHTVKGITPAGTTVNLFDYDPQIGNRDNDVLPDGAEIVSSAAPASIVPGAAAHLIQELFLPHQNGVEGETLYDVLQANPAFAGFAPKTLHHRFLTEDTPYSMVPMAALGRLAGVPTPIMDALIALLGELLGEDYAVTGQTAERMGLAGMTPEAIRNLVSA